MKEFISDLGVIPSVSSPMEIFCDNTGAITCEGIQISQENQTHQEMLQFHPASSRGWRHRDLQIHTDLNVADPLTKPLS